MTTVPGWRQDVEPLLHAGRAELSGRRHVAQHRGGDLRRFTARSREAGAERVQHVTADRLALGLGQV
jgi:hypothetical protein